MDLGDVKIATGFDVQLFHGIIVFLFERGVIPDRFTDPDDIVEVIIDQPVIEVDDPAGAPMLVLHVTGSFTPASGGGSSPFDARIGLEPFVRPVAGAAPVAALRVDERVELTPPGIGFVVEAVADAFLDELLGAMDLPLFDPLIARVENVFFPLVAPGREEWSADCVLGRRGSLDHVEVGFPPGRPDLPRIECSTPLSTTPALVATLALPGEDPSLPGGASIVPEATGAQILIAEATMNAMLAAQAATIVGTSVEGATVTGLSMQMNELGIQIDGLAENEPATIEWQGTLLIFFSKRYTLKSRGAVRWHDGFVNVFASGVDVGVDTPRWVTFLRAVGAVLLGPVYSALDATLVQPRLDQADEAPDLVRSAFRDEATAALGTMIANASNMGDEMKAPLMIFGHDAWVLGGHYTTSLIAFAGSNQTTIDDSEHDRFDVTGASGSSVGLVEIGTGHALHPEELGRLLKAGIVRIPGYHGVEAPYGFYIRSSPNGTHASGHRRRSIASANESTTTSAVPDARATDSGRYFPVRTSTPFMPTACAPSTSFSTSSPIIATRSAPRSRSANAARKNEGDGLPITTGDRPTAASNAIT